MGKISQAKKKRKSEINQRYYSENKNKVKDAIKERRKKNTKSKPIETRSSSQGEAKHLKRKAQQRDSKAKARKVKKEEEENKQRKKKEEEDNKKRKRSAHTARMKVWREKTLGNEKPKEGQGFGKSPKSKKTRQRTVKRVKDKLPKTPRKRAECIEQLAASPSVQSILEEKGVIQSKDSQKSVRVAKAVLADIKEAKSTLTSDKTPQAQHLVQRGLAMSFGKNVEKSRLSGELCKELGISKPTARKYSKIRKTGAWKMLQRMDSEILWEILKFPNFEYYPAGCAILEYGAAF